MGKNTINPYSGRFKVDFTKSFVDLNPDDILTFTYEYIGAPEMEKYITVEEGVIWFEDFPQEMVGSDFTILLTATDNNSSGDPIGVLNVTLPMPFIVETKNYAP